VFSRADSSTIDPSSWLPLFVNTSGKFKLELWTSISSSSDGIKLIASHAGYMAADPVTNIETWNESKLYKSSDSGATWEKCNVGYTMGNNINWSCVTSSEDGKNLAATVYGGYIYISSNGGVSWYQSSGSPYQNWHSISSSADGQILIASNYDESVYISNDGGNTWDKCSIAK
jgi:photosystem II stability/assembly factor-like uncharacterized protein